MGKGTDLWDDSALLDAFDRALFTYKAMHHQANFVEEEEQRKNDNGNGSSFCTKITAESKKLKDGNNCLANETLITPCHEDTTTDNEFLPQGSNFGEDLNASESHQYSSGFVTTDGKDGDYPNQQNSVYDELLKQYYELEEQRHSVLQQLQQASYWNYQGPVQSSTCQHQQLSAYNTSGCGLNPTCSLCSCYSLAVPVVPLSACCMSGQSSGGGSCLPWIPSCSQAHNFLGGHYPAQYDVCPNVMASTLDQTKNAIDGDEKFVKAGTLAAESTINVVKSIISGDFSSSKSKENKEEESTSVHEGKGLEGFGSEAELAAVLSAWYSAGFHTGRYLSERSRKSS